MTALATAFQNVTFIVQYRPVFIDALAEEEQKLEALVESLNKTYTR